MNHKCLWSLIHKYGTSSPEEGCNNSFLLKVALFANRGAQRGRAEQKTLKSQRVRYAPRGRLPFATYLVR